jgi:predicted nucleic-acid-binding protein
LKGLDTNVLVRYLTKDDLPQWQIADRLINDIVAASETCLINNIVLCELVWVLKSAYKLSREEIAGTLEKILQGSAFDFEDRKAALWAVQQMKAGNADFADYLIGKVNQQAGCTETATFDAKLKNSDGFKHIG